MKKGFTLIELMIVIAIIGLLAAVALPKFGNATESAKAANVQGNLATLRGVISIFYAGQKQFPTSTGTAAASRDIFTNGNLGSEFTKYYSRDTMPNTPATPLTASTLASNAVQALNDTATARTVVGGWTYWYGGDNIGEIQANLPDNTFGVADWSLE